MSFMKVGEEQHEDTDAKVRKNDEANAILNSAAAIRTLKDVEVRNVCGSTAGAGSGTFHKYTQCKRREKFRLEKLNREAKIVKANERLKKRKREQDDLIEMQRNKRRKMRQKKKNRKKMHQKNMAAATNTTADGGGGSDTAIVVDANDVTVSSTIGSANAIQSELAELMAIDESLSNAAANQQLTSSVAAVGVGVADDDDDDASDNDSTAIETTTHTTVSQSNIIETDNTQIISVNDETLTKSADETTTDETTTTNVGNIETVAVETEEKTSNEGSADIAIDKTKMSNDGTTDATVDGTVNSGTVEEMTLKYKGTAQNKNAAPQQMTKEQLIAQSLKEELDGLFD